MKYGLTIVTGPSIKRETTMEQFIGLDVSLKDTFVSVREDGQRVWLRIPTKWAGYSGLKWATAPT